MVYTIIGSKFSMYGLHVVSTVFAISYGNALVTLNMNTLHQGKDHTSFAENNYVVTPIQDQIISTRSRVCTQTHTHTYARTHAHKLTVQQNSKPSFLSNSK